MVCAVGCLDCERGRGWVLVCDPFYLFVLWRDRDRASHLEVRPNAAVLASLADVTKVSEHGSVCSTRRQKKENVRETRQTMLSLPNSATQALRTSLSKTNGLGCRASEREYFT